MPAAGMQRANLHQSTMSTVTRLPSRWETALMMVRISFAMRPWRPMTLLISSRNVKLQNGALAVLALRDRHGLGIVNKLLCHIEQEFLHRAVPLDQRTLAFFKSAFTVSVG